MERIPAPSGQDRRGTQLHPQAASSRLTSHGPRLSYYQRHTEGIVTHNCSTAPRSAQSSPAALPRACECSFACGSMVLSPFTLLIFALRDTKSATIENEYCPAGGKLANCISPKIIRAVQLPMAMITSSAQRLMTFRSLADTITAAWNECTYSTSILW